MISICYFSADLSLDLDLERDLLLLLDRESRSLLRRGDRDRDLRHTDVSKYFGKNKRNPGDKYLERDLDLPPLPSSYRRILRRKVMNMTRGDMPLHQECRDMTLGTS